MAQASKLLIVDDEESFIDALQSGLSREGFIIDVARDGHEALERFEAGAPDLILLDVMLPGISGIDVCRRIRIKSDVPIIMVSARNEEIDTVVGLEVGADDYISKPYRLRELVARIRVGLRRARPRDADAPTAEQLQVGDISLHTQRHEVEVRGKRVNLPRKEFDLLGLLMANAGRVLSRDTLIARVWGDDYFGDTKTLDTHIKRLRARVEDDPSRPVLIVTVRGLGYKYTSDD